MPRRRPLVACLWFFVVVLPLVARGDRSEKWIPVAQLQAGESFKSLLRKLAAFSKTRIGPIGGGPVLAAPDVLVAEKLTLMATREQLKDLLSVDNGAVRAHIARSIIRHRPAEVALVAPLRRDSFRIAVGSMRDTPPIQDLKMSIGELIKRELAIAGL